jgi:hypothetical protein
LRPARKIALFEIERGLGSTDVFNTCPKGHQPLLTATDVVEKQLEQVVLSKGIATKYPIPMGVADFGEILTSSVQDLIEFLELGSQRHDFPPSYLCICS